MKIVFRKIFEEEHSVHVDRTGGSKDSTVLNSRSFLRHDLAHLAEEMEVPPIAGHWKATPFGAEMVLDWDDELSSI